MSAWHHYRFDRFIFKHPLNQIKTFIWFSSNISLLRVPQRTTKESSFEPLSTHPSARHSLTREPLSVVIPTGLFLGFTFPLLARLTAQLISLTQSHGSEWLMAGEKRLGAPPRSIPGCKSSKHHHVRPWQLHSLMGKDIDWGAWGGWSKPPGVRLL